MKTLALFSLVLFAPAKPIPAKVAEVLKAPAKYDGKAVTVKGKVAEFKARTSKAGRDYYTFDLVDGKAKLKVYGGNKLTVAPKDGDSVTVTGKYAKERKVGERTFKDEVDASARLDKAFGVKK
jgi:phosphatidate phosphatase PAH1